MQRFVRLINSLTTIGGNIAAVSVVLVLGMIIVHVFARRVLNSPLLFGEEISGYLLVAIIFFGLAYTMKTDGHVRVDAVLSKTSGKLRVILEKMCTVVAIFFALFFFAGNYVRVKDFYVKKTISIQDLEIPLVIPAVMLILGAGLLLLQLIARLFSPVQKETED